jgi:DNA invertase Pin-like site-specific DNA recombinase
MANALVIRRSTTPAKRSETLRAAQYVRMSTDYQRYSIQNQAAAIAAFAQQKNLSIVRTYMDEGRSGLRIRGRAGLTELIDDVRSGHADFDHVLVYDVSRWGRFQDVDESAHYEFICKQNGIKVAYCAEQFDNDGSLLSSIVKNIKRVMAAEYSRELSVKVHTGLCRIASLGFHVGGPLTFGLRRELVSENLQSKGLLEKGERKSLQTDRVRLALGPPDEAAVVRWIFQACVIGKKSDAAIARELNQSEIPNQYGRPWTGGMIATILRNENYVGNIVYNRSTCRLGQKRVKNPIDRWVRGDMALDPIVERSHFESAQRILENRYVTLSEDEMLVRLRLLLKRKGKLSLNLIDAAADAPSAASYTKHFGSIRKAFGRIGYKVPRDCDWIDRRVHWSEVLAAHANTVAAALDATKHAKIEVDKRRVIVTVKGTVQLHFVVVRQIKRKRPSHSPVWRMYRAKIRRGLLVLLRLNEANSTIADYLVAPAARLTGTFVYLSDTSNKGTVRAGTIEDLVAVIKGYIKKDKSR